MVLTINAKSIELDQTEIQDLKDDLGSLAVQIDEVLAGDDSQANIQKLMVTINSLADLYS